MRHTSGARWITWATALVFTGISGLIIADYALHASRAEQAVATPVDVTERVRRLTAEGDRRFAAGDLAGALQAWDEVLALDPADYTAYYRAGVALSHMGDHEQAVALFRQVVRLGPPEREEVRRARQWLEAAGVPQAAR
jgi:tetratricopeptide (TPR) repeat protein